MGQEERDLHKFPEPRHTCLPCERVPVVRPPVVPCPDRSISLLLKSSTTAMRLVSIRQSKFFPRQSHCEANRNKSTRIIEIQGRMSERAIELLCLPAENSCFILDLGCGSGLSGQVLEEDGHCWIGVDISEAMLDVAVERKQEEDISSCDLIQGDLGQGLPFRSGSFDGAISISALQWLCNADKSSHRPVQRLLTLFTSLYSCLTRGSRAVLQFYPENASQMELVTNQAMKAGFTGGVVVDYPNSAKAKKMFLVLFTGGNNTNLPRGLEHESSSTVKYTEERRDRMRDMRGKAPKKSRDWIIEKKARKRRQGREVRPDTKYTGRKRTGKFF